MTSRSFFAAFASDAFTVMELTDQVKTLQAVVFKGEPWVTESKSTTAVQSTNITPSGSVADDWWPLGNTFAAVAPRFSGF